VKIWAKFGNEQSTLPAGLAAFDAEAHKAYCTAWMKVFGVAPKDDATHSPPHWDNEDIIKKRQLLWNFGLSLAGSQYQTTVLLGIACRIYALLPLYKHGMDTQMCFYPASDLPNKKKLAQVERQSRLTLAGSGTVLVGVLCCIIC
jgi:hypothetical protein